MSALKRVMVVDDEKLVRQGIVTTFPWEKHGFTVACDANSGEKALELLRETEIDLLVTDLTMNGMSGLELIRRARELRGDLPVVILTCHDDFKYVQDAIRLGVLDYIVKTEIEDEAVDEMLTRIASKLAAVKEAPGQEADREESLRDGLLLCGPERSAMPGRILAKFGQEGWAGRLAEVDTATWFVRVTERSAARWKDEAALAGDGEGWGFVHIAGIDEPDDGKVIERLRQYRRRVLFYHPPGGAGDMEVLEWSALAEAPAAAASASPDVRPNEAERSAADELRSEWSGPEWIYSGDRFAELLRKTAAASLDSGQLAVLLYPAVLEWERLIGAGTLGSFLERVDEWLYWRDWESWLKEFRKTILRKVERNASRQHAEAVFRGIELIRSRLDLNPGEHEIAAAVNLSRGHFSKLFKKVTGQSYGDYVRTLKMERAKELLLRTDEPITRVAERVGFQDYRYFSRAFRSYTGMLPTEFRKTEEVRIR